MEKVAAEGETDDIVNILMDYIEIANMGNMKSKRLIFIRLEKIAALSDDKMLPPKTNV